VAAERDRRLFRRRRQLRGRQKVRGTAERPRLCVTKSLKHIYAQIIDDTARDGTGHTLVAASTLDQEVAEGLNSTQDTAAAQATGEAVAKRALEKGIAQVVYDRAGYPYQGRVRALAEAAREAGLQF
jgi:large subunit ribosomal protein L18